MIARKHFFNLLNGLGLEIKSPHWWLQVLIISIVYPLICWFLTANNKMAWVPLISPYISPVWPGTGWMLATLLEWGYSRWLGIFIGQFIWSIIIVLLMTGLTLTLWADGATGRLKIIQSGNSRQIA